MPISTTATADAAAALALGYLAYKDASIPEEQKMAGIFLESAEKAWAFLENNPHLIMTQERYSNKEYGGPYTDHKDTDERLWAAVELFHATGKEKYHSFIKENIPLLLKQERLGDPTPDWQNVNFDRNRYRRYRCGFNLPRRNRYRRTPKTSYHRKIYWWGIPVGRESFWISDQ